MEKPEFLQINIRRKLDQLGWSYKKFSLESGVSYHTIFRALSKGIVPRGENLRKMGAALGLSVSDLLKDPNSVPVEAKRANVVTLSDLSKSEERIIEALKSPQKPYRVVSKIPPEIEEFWDSAGSSSQLACLYLLTGRDQYKQHLRDAIRTRLEALYRCVHPRVATPKKGR